MSKEGDDLLNNYPRGSYQLSKAFTLKDIENFNVAKLRLFAFISLEFTRNKRGKSIEEKITMVIDPMKHKKLFPRRDDFYEAIDFFIERGVLFKVSDKTYEINITMLNCFTYEQNKEMTLKSDKNNF